MTVLILNSEEPLTFLPRSLLQVLVFDHILFLYAYVSSALPVLRTLLRYVLNFSVFITQINYEDTTRTAS